MTTFLKMIFSVSLGLFLSFSAFAGNGDCVNCPVGKDQKNSDKESFFRMTKVACTQDGKPESFDRLFCASISWFVDEHDFEARIKKCEMFDPKGRTTIGEYLRTLNCESRYIDELQHKLKRDGYDIKGRTVTGLSTLFLDSDNVMGTARTFHDTVRTYRKMGKENGYKELKEFATVLNRKDDNGHTFLDNIMMRYNDPFVENVGLGIDNVRAQLIKIACKIGGEFSNPEHTKRFNCVSDPKYAD